MKLAYDMSVIQLQCFHLNKTKCFFHSIADFDADYINPFFCTDSDQCFVYVSMRYFSGRTTFSVEIHFSVCTLSLRLNCVINLLAASAIMQKNWFTWLHCMRVIRVRLRMQRVQCINSKFLMIVRVSGFFAFKVLCGQ